jgi:hypothetical protein
MVYLMPRELTGPAANPLRMRLQFQSNLEAEFRSPFPDRYQVQEQHQEVHRTSLLLQVDLQTPRRTRGFACLESGSNHTNRGSAKAGAEP